MQFESGDGQLGDVVSVVSGHAVHRGRLLVVCVAADPGQEPPWVLVLDTPEQADGLYARIVGSPKEANR